MMRFRGGGVGHKSTRVTTNFFMRDRDRLDTKATQTESKASLLNNDMTQAIEQDDDDDEPVDGGAVGEELAVNEEEEEDYGYVREDSEPASESETSESKSESEAEQVGQPDGEDDISDQDLGPEDDAEEAVDTLDECRYADL